jgi:hypothetical protein
MHVSRLLNPENVFVTNYANSDFIFAHLHEKTMLIESITMISVFKSLSGGYPLGSALIFTADHPSYFS